MSIMEMRLQVVLIQKNNMDSYNGTSSVVAVANGKEAARIWVQKQLDTKPHYSKTLEEAIGREYTFVYMDLETEENQEL